MSTIDILTYHFTELKYLISYFLQNENNSMSNQLLIDGILKLLDDHPCSVNNDNTSNNKNVVQVYKTKKCMGRVLCIVGEIGVGKTVLIQSFTSLLKASTNMFDIDVDNVIETLQKQPLNCIDINNNNTDDNNITANYTDNSNTTPNKKYFNVSVFIVFLLFIYFFYLFIFLHVFYSTNQFY